MKKTLMILSVFLLALSVVIAPPPPEVVDCSELIPTEDCGLYYGDLENPNPNNPTADPAVCEAHYEATLNPERPCKWFQFECHPAFGGLVDNEICSFPEPAAEVPEFGPGAIAAIVIVALVAGFVFVKRK